MLSDTTITCQLQHAKDLSPGANVLSLQRRHFSLALLASFCLPIWVIEHVTFQPGGTGPRQQRLRWACLHF